MTPAAIGTLHLFGPGRHAKQLLKTLGAILALIFVNRHIALDTPE
jgi:hypothetical protein